MSKLTREQSQAILRELRDLEMRRTASFHDISDSELQKLHKEIEHRVVALVRDTQHDRKLHNDVMAELDKQEIEMDRFNDWLGPVILDEEMLNDNSTT